MNFIKEVISAHEIIWMVCSFKSASGRTFRLNRFYWISESEFHFLFCLKTNTKELTEFVFWLFSSFIICSFSVEDNKSLFSKFTESVFILYGNISVMVTLQHKEKDILTLQCLGWKGTLHSVTRINKCIVVISYTFPLKIHQDKIFLCFPKIL